jgi:hypothetical protein
VLAIDFLEFLRGGLEVVLGVQEKQAFVVQPVGRIVGKRQVLVAEPGARGERRGREHDRQDADQRSPPSPRP